MKHKCKVLRSTWATAMNFKLTNIKALLEAWRPGGEQQKRAPRTDPGAFQYLEVRGEEKPVKEKSLCMEKSRSEEIRRAGILEVK